VTFSAHGDLLIIAPYKYRYLLMSFWLINIY